MKYKIFILLLPLALLMPLNASALSSVYELTLKGKKCEEKGNQSLECEYKVGKSLYIVISGIGQLDTGITFMKSDFTDDFYATFGLMHGCIVVKRGVKYKKLDYFLDFAFISPNNGKIYETWKECQKGL